MNWFIFSLFRNGCSLYSNSSIKEPISAALSRKKLLDENSFLDSARVTL
jgi:hypothetical protein